MSYDNSGTLFRNENRKSDKAPEYSGKATIGGRIYYLDAWVKESKAGKKFFSIAIKPADPVEALEKAVAKEFGPGARVREQRREDLDDEIPF